MMTMNKRGVSKVGLLLLIVLDLQACAILYVMFLGFYSAPLSLVLLSGIYIGSAIVCNLWIIADYLDRLWGDEEDE